jgi:hypothetical protein
MTIRNLFRSILPAIIILAFDTPSNAIGLIDINSTPVPQLNQQWPPLSAENNTLLFQRIIATFNNKYKTRIAKTSHNDPADKYSVYYLRQELQALIDMWRATNDNVYLNKAKFLVLKSIDASVSSQRQLLWHNQPRGTWPCFFSKELEKITGGHGQLWDFQGAAGFMMVAVALKQNQDSDWRKIADFVEANIITKWLFYNPSIKPEYYSSPESNKTILTVLDGARDKREHFASICMNLNSLGYNKYPYQQWAVLLVNIYLSEKPDSNSICPVSGIPNQTVPKDWGVTPNKLTNGYIWYWMIDWKNQLLSIQDTSHANRTVWLATKAYSENMLDTNRLNRFINTFKYQVWAKNKGPFYFNNYIDGTDTKAQQLGPGKNGNVWFGWHRLAAYDDVLKDLYISIAYDLTNGGGNIPDSQNKQMEEAPLCFLAWAARLLAPNGQPQLFP